MGREIERQIIGREKERERERESLDDKDAIELVPSVFFYFI